MPSPSTPFDDAADDRRDVPGTDAPDDTGNVERDADGPNYLVRRAIVVGVVVVLVAAAGIVAGALIGGSDDTNSSGAASAEWNRVVLIDQRTGKISLTDESGDEVAEIDTSLGDPTDSAVVGPTALLTAEDTTAVVDLGSQDVETVELGAEGIVRPTGSTLTMIAPAATGRRGLLVHGPSGDTFDTDTLTEVTGADYDFAHSLSDVSGRDVLVTDAGNFQSVLFSFDRDEPSFFPGLALAVDDDIVVTAQNVGNDATVSVFDHTGESIGSGRTASVRAAMISGDQIHLVTVDGQIVTMDAGSGDTDDGEQLGIGTIMSGAVMTSGDRLVVTGSAGTAIIDDGGALVTVAADSRPGESAAALQGSTCISVITEAASGPAELAIIDATDGTTVAEGEIAGDTIERSADGCTVAIGLDAGYDVLDADGVISVADDVLVALSPDGLDTVVERDRRLVLGVIDAPTDSDAEPTEIAPRGRSVAFTEL